MKYISVIMSMVLISIFAVSCGKKSIPSEEEVIKTLELISGSGQVDRAGTLLTDSLWVRVKDNNDSPIENAVINFTQITPDSGGQIIWDERTTDINGLAFTLYRLDIKIGVDTIQATLAEDSTEFVYFVVTVIASDSVMMFIDHGDNQFNTAGERLPDSCVVFVKDQYNNPASGHLIRFVSEDRCVVVTDSTSDFETDTAYTYTDVNGKAWAIWYLTINYDPGSSSYPMRAYSMISDSILGSVLFGALSSAPDTMEYYNDIRSIFEQPMNCMSCHSGDSRGGDYALDFYYELLKDSNLVPGDTNSLLLSFVTPDHKLNSINMVEVDKVIRWVVTDSAGPGSSGKLNYQTDIRPIIEDRCTKLCHTLGQMGEEYLMDSHSGIRDTGSEVTPNAIPGDSSSLLVQKLLVGGTMRPYLSVDLDSMATLADLLINWIVDDSLRQY